MSFISFLHSDACLYGLMIFSSALLGWVTNVLALKMLFYPIVYRGIKPLGWQGVIPAQASVLTEHAAELMSQHLLTLEECFAQIDPHSVAEELAPDLVLLTEQIVD